MLVDLFPEESSSITRKPMLSVSAFGLKMGPRIFSTSVRVPPPEHLPFCSLTHAGEATPCCEH